MMKNGTGKTMKSVIKFAQLIKSSSLPCALRLRQCKLPKVLGADVPPVAGGHININTAQGIAEERILKTKVK
jgi:hypothetical protein